MSEKSDKSPDEIMRELVVVLRRAAEEAGAKILRFVEAVDEATMRWP